MKQHAPRTAQDLIWAGQFIGIYQRLITEAQKGTGWQSRLREDPLYCKELKKVLSYSPSWVQHVDQRGRRLSIGAGLQRLGAWYAHVHARGVDAAEETYFMEELAALLGLTPTRLTQLLRVLTEAMPTGKSMGTPFMIAMTMVLDTATMKPVKEPMESATTTVETPMETATKMPIQTRKEVPSTQSA